MKRSHETLSVCPVCYREVLACVWENDHGHLLMTKQCQNHGEFGPTLMEKSGAFHKIAMAKTGNKWANGQLVNLEVTHRCNNRCPNCYHVRDRHEPSLEFLVAKALSFPINHVCLVGGEPTLRRDLLSLIESLADSGMQVSIYTNGIKLADPGFTRELVATRLSNIGFSLHHPSYSHPKIYAKKLQALENLRQARPILHHISFSVQSLAEVPDILDLIPDYRGLVTEVRLRSPYRETQTDFFCSELAQAAGHVAQGKRKDLIFSSGAHNSLYNVGMLYDGIPLWLMSWPHAGNVCLHNAKGLPMAAYEDGLCTNFLHMIILQDGIRKGWFAGCRIS
jgi:hypothetical protein